MRKLLIIGLGALLIVSVAGCAAGVGAQGNGVGAGISVGY